MTNTFKKSFLVIAACLMAGGMFADQFVLDFSTQSTTHAVFPINATLSQFQYSSNSAVAGWNLLLVDNGASFSITNVTGATITAIKIEGVCDNNSNKSTTVELSDGTSKLTTGSSSWSNRKSTSMTTKNLSNINKLKMDAGTVYTITNSGYKVGMRITITYSGGSVVTPTVSSVALSPSTATMEINDTQQLTATVNATPATADKTITWTTSDASVATVDENGLVTAVAQGTATITATSNLDNTKSGTCTVTVNAPAAPVQVTAIDLNNATTAIAIGSSETLTINYTPTDANTGKAVNWTSSDDNIATVDNTGKVTGVAAGTATITATSTTDNSITASCEVTVQAVAVTGVTMTPTAANVQVNGTANLTATVLPANATNKAVTWSTSDASVATVNNGTVVGIAAGSATITVKTDDGQKTATCTVTVTAGPPVPATTLTLHEPGVYEGKTKEGGYGTDIIAVGGREFEVYYFGKSKPAGASGDIAVAYTLNHTGGYLVSSPSGSGTSMTAKDGWFKATISSLEGSFKGLDEIETKASARDEFAGLPGDLRMKNNNSFELHIQGYDQFSIVAQDKKIDTKGTTPNDNRYWEVYIDDILQPQYFDKDNATTRRYAITTGRHVITMKAIGGEESKLYAFSLRVAQVPKTSILKGNDSTQIVMQGETMRPVTYYTKYNSFGETLLIWEGAEATGISLEKHGSSNIGDTLVLSGMANCPVGVYNYIIRTDYNGTIAGGMPGKFEVQSDIKAMTTTAADGYEGMNIDDIKFTYHALSADSITLTWENNNAPAGITGSGTNGIYTISGVPTSAGTFIYTVSVSGGNSISDTILIKKLDLGNNPILYLYKNALAYNHDGVYQYLTSNSHNLIAMKTLQSGKRTAEQYAPYKWILISEDADANNPEVIELIRNGSDKPILNLKGFTYAKGEDRLGWGDPNNGAVDSTKKQDAGSYIIMERSDHPIFSNLAPADGKKVKILDNYEKNGVMPITINNMPSYLASTCLATAPTRGEEYYEEGPLQTAIHEIPAAQHGGGKYICLPLARQVTLSADGKKLLSNIINYLLSPTPTSVKAPTLQITSFTVEGIPAVINEEDKTIKLELTVDKFKELDSLRSTKPVITLADSKYSHVSPASGEEVSMQYSIFMGKTYEVTDYVNRVVYEFKIQLINPQGIEEVYEAGQWVNVFDIYGRKVATTNEDIYTMDLPRGMYIVVTESGNTLKIMR